MLWIEKYRPTSFGEMEGHQSITGMLEAYSVETVPHLMISGLQGHGKRTLLYSLIRHLYGSFPVMKLKKVEVATSTNKKLEVSFLESEEFVEISLSEYGYHDKLVVQTFIKQIAQTKPMLNFFRRKSSLNIKIIAITNADNLSKGAQAALRRTIEIYSSTFRLILVCNQLSAIIEPIRSRFLSIRIPGFTQKISEHICSKALASEGFSLDQKIVAEICASSRGNMKRALSLLEAHCLNHAIDGVKRQKTDVPVLSLDWERQVDAIAKRMRQEQSSQSLKVIREGIYSLLGSCISPKDIMLVLLKHLLEDQSLKTCSCILEYASTYDERLRLGTKDIVHLESFAASVLVLLSRTNLFEKTSLP